MNTLVGLLFSLILIIINFAIIYWLIKSAINDSELVSLLRSIDQKLSTMKIDVNSYKPSWEKRHSATNKGDHTIIANKEVVDGFYCPACTAYIPRDSKVCPDCGIVFLDDEK